MVSFLALYRGQSIGSAELVAVSTDSDLIAEVASRLLIARDDPQLAEREDLALGAVKEGRRRALQIVLADAERER